MQISQTINAVFSNLAAGAESTHRRNAKTTIDRENLSEGSRLLASRCVRLDVTRFQDLSFTIRGIQIQTEDGDEVTVDQMMDLLKKEELTFERFGTLEQALDHAKLSMKYGHAFVEILAGIARHVPGKISYGATASFYRPALVIAVKEDENVVMFQFSE